MDDEVARERLTVWWDTLTADDQAELVGLEEGDELPGRHVVGVTKALHVGPIGAVRVVDDLGDFTLYVDERLGRFLADRRDLA